VKLAPNRNRDLGVIVDSSRGQLNRMYDESFVFFQMMFRPKADVTKIQLQSHLPGSVYQDRRVLGTILTAAIVAMLDHRCRSGGRSLTPDELLAVVKLIAPPQLIWNLDEIIIAQLGSLGGGLLASDLALMRFIHFQQHDYKKQQRALRAMDKAAKVAQMKTARPLTDPYLREAKALAIKELQPVLETVRERFRLRNRRATTAELVQAFEQEARNPGQPFLNNPHNLVLLLEFVKQNPIVLDEADAPEFFDAFVGCTTKHDAEYARQRVSRAT
jgi:hypothetical protein